MPDKPFGISPSAPPPPTEADYEAIHAAVMETVRGRWFLSEYAKRNRHADTSLILAAIDRVEALWRERGTAASPAERVHFDLVEMAKAIAQTRSEIASIKPDGDAKGSLSEATEELHSIVHTTERATSDILAAAEQVQEIAWTLREHGADSASCDALDRRATDIYSACSFQDLTGQRIRKVVEVLRFLEARIRAMIDIWGNAGPAPTEAATAPHIGRDQAGQLAQPEIDRIMPAPDEPAATAAVASEARTEVQAEVQAEIPAEVHADVHAESRTEAHEAPGDEMVDAVASHAIEIVAEPLIAAPAAAAASHAGAVVAAENFPAADLVITPAIVGATALALDPSPVEAAPAPEPARLAEWAHEAVAEPAPQPEPQPVPSPEAEPTADAERSTDPAEMLKRILALIRTPSGASLEVNVADPPADGSDDAAGAPELVMTLAVLEPAAADDAAAPANSFAAELTAAEPAVAEAPTVEPSVADAPVAQAAVGEGPVPPAAVADAAADDILTPLGARLTVDQAVDELLGKAPVRASFAMPEQAEPVLPVMAQSPPAPAAEPAVTRAEPPFTLDVPTPVIAPTSLAPAPLAPPHVETMPPADAPAREPAPQEARPAPVAATSPPAATAPPAAVAETAVAAMPPAELALETVVTATFRQPSQPLPPRLRPLLAAIAALSDEDKIALFS